MKILYLIPGLRTSDSVQQRIDKWSWVPDLLGKDVTLVGRGFEKGSENSEGDFDDYVVGGELVRTLIEIEDDGFDAVVVGDTGDPFVPGIREFLNVPIVGPMEASLKVATLLGHRFSLITPAKYMIPRKEKQVYSYGYGNHLASVRSLNVSVSEVKEDPERIINLLVEEAEKAVREDGAQVVIQMCGFMVEYYPQVLQQVDFPVIEPIRAALKLAETLVRLNLSHSKLLYIKPKNKLRIF